MDVKSQPDTLSVDVAQRTENKVALDIDDAPFLVEEAPPAPARAPAVVKDTALALSPEDSLDGNTADSQKKKKRLLIIIASAVGACVIAGGLVWWFVLRVPPVPPIALEPEIIRVPPPPKDALTQDFVVEFAPFWVEYPGDANKTLFLTCKFAVITQSDLLVQEARNKMPTLRDAVFYYLKNRPYAFLLEPANAQTVKTDIASVLSGYLVGGKIDGVVFESYLAK